MVKQEHIPVFYEGQDDLIEILATTMASVCYATKSFIDFYILDCGICDFNKKLLEGMKDKFDNFSIDFIPIDLKQFEGLRGYTVHNFVDCYSRLMIPELKPEINCAIYLDTDTIALKDINELWQEDLDGKSLGAVPDLGLTPFVADNFIKKLHGDPQQVYLSGGVFILDCQKWREKHITNDLLNLARRKKDQILIIIEDLFSIYFTQDYKLLDCRYAMIDADMDTSKIPVKSIDEKYMHFQWLKIAIMHFAGYSKPWHHAKSEVLNRHTRNFDLFWFFAKMTPFYYGLQARFTENIVRF